MDILFVTRWTPRLNGGGTQQRAAVHLRALAGLGRVHLLYIGGGRPALDEETLRMVHHVVTVQEAGLAGVPGEEPFSSGWVRRRIIGAWGISGWLGIPRPCEAALLRAALKAQWFDIVFAFHIGSALVADAVLPHRTTTLRIIDWDFIESVNVVEWAMRGALHLPLTRWLSTRFGAWKVYRLEQRVFARWGLHLCSSPIDVPYLQHHAPAARVLSVENACQAPDHPPAVCVNETPTVLFVGTMAYWPNLDAAQHFMDEVWPLVRKALPAAQLRVVGRAAPPELLRRGGRHGIEVHSDVPDLQPFYEQAHLAVVPLRHAIGSNLKIPEAMAHARAVVGYRGACDRTGLDTDCGVDSVQTARELAYKVIYLLKDSKLSAAMGLKAHATALSRLNLRVIESKMRGEVLRSLASRG